MCQSNCQNAIDADYYELAHAVLKLLYHFFSNIRSVFYFSSRRGREVMRASRIAYFYIRNRRRYSHLLDEYERACMKVYGGRVDCINDMARVISVVVRKFSKHGVEPFRTLYDVLRRDTVDVNMVRALLTPYVTGDARVELPPSRQRV